MSLQTRLAAFITEVGADIKNVRTSTVCVFNYTTGNEARPTGYTYVEWRGPGNITPVNAVNGDSWVATS